MKVYLVASGGKYDGYSIEKVFGSRKKAEAFAKPIQEKIQLQARKYDVDRLLRHWLYKRKPNYYIETSEIIERLKKVSRKYGSCDFCSVWEFEVE